MYWQVSYNEPDAAASGGFRFLAQTCAVEVAYTVTAPDAVAYQIRLSDSGSNFDWQGVVNARGEVTEGS